MVFDDCTLDTHNSDRMVVESLTTKTTDGAKVDETNANSARIRDNQRRSRARRKEYVSELEEKFRVCQQTGVEANAELQAAARGVLEENKRLRRLLESHGIPIYDTTETAPSGDQSAHGAAEELEYLLACRKPCQQEISSCQPAHEQHRRPITPGCMPTSEPVVLEVTTPMQPMDQQKAAQAFIQTQTSPLSTFGQTVYSPTHGDPIIHGVHQAISPPHIGPYSASDISTEPTSWPTIANVAAVGIQYTDEPLIASSTTQCSSAADLIRIARPGLGCELEQDMGCQNGSTGCSVHNAHIFDLMEKYSVG